MGTSTATGISPDMVFLTQKVSQAISQQSSLLQAQADTKDHFKSLPKHTRNSLIFGQVGPHSLTLPLTPSEMAIEVFKQKNTYAFYQMIHAQIFCCTDNNCYMLFGQCSILQKFGPRWRAEEQPSGFPPLSFNPYDSCGAHDPRAMDYDIQEDLFESNMHQSNGLSTKDMRQIFRNQKLFYPVTTKEFHLQLRSYYLLAVAIWNNESFIAIQTQKLLEHYLSNRKVYTNNQIDDSTFLCKVLFSLDHAIQHFIKHQLEDAKCIEDIQVRRLAYHVDKLCNKITSREDVCRMPRAILVEVQSKARENDVRFGNRGTGGAHSAGNNKNRDNPKKRANDHGTADHEPTSSRVRFESPADWKLSPEMKYSTAFPKPTLVKIPSVTIHGKTRPFCNKLFSLQSCRNGSRCYFSHANPADHGKTEEMNKFYSEAYATAKRS